MFSSGSSADSLEVPVVVLNDAAEKHGKPPRLCDDDDDEMMMMMMMVVVVVVVMMVVLINTCLPCARRHCAHAHQSISDALSPEYLARDSRHSWLELSARSLVVASTQKRRIW